MSGLVTIYASQPARQPASPPASQPTHPHANHDAVLEMIPFINFLLMLTLYTPGDAIEQSSAVTPLISWCSAMFASRQTAGRQRHLSAEDANTRISCYQSSSGNVVL